MTELRAQILDLVGEYCAATFPAGDFIPGSTKVPVSGKVFDAAKCARWSIPPWTSG